MKNKQLKETFQQVIALIPAGKSKEEVDLFKACVLLAENALCNLNTIASALEAIAMKHGNPVALDDTN